MSVVVYGLATCDTCRKARKWLQRFGVDHDFIDYRAQPIPATTLKEWACQLGGREKLVNKSSTTWRNLLPQRKNPASDPEWSMQGALAQCLEWHRARRHRVRQDADRKPCHGRLLAFNDGGVHVGFSDNGFKKLFGKP